MNIFDNAKFYPLGAANLEFDKKSIKIQNLTNSGLDGVLIDVDGAEEFSLTFKDFEIGIDNSFNISHLGIDEWGRVKTLAQQTTYYNPKNKRVEMAFNSRLLSKKGILLQGFEDDKIVFQGRYPNPEFNPNINWWILLAAAIIYVADHVDYTYTKTTGPDGTTTSHSVSWNGGSSGGGGGLVTFDGIRFNASKLVLTSEEFIPKGIPVNNIKAVQITARNYKELEIIKGKIC